jgi:pantoate--beta-alanine ligase
MRRKPTSQSFFDFDGLENQMEANSDPAILTGLALLLKRLLRIVAPTNAYFGEKDFQQLQIVKKWLPKITYL